MLLANLRTWQVVKATTTATTPHLRVPAEPRTRVSAAEISACGPGAGLTSWRPYNRLRYQRQYANGAALRKAALTVYYSDLRVHR